MNAVHLVSGCTCVLCGTWRRIGNLLTRSPPVEAFHTFALRRLRELYTELLDAAESCTVVGGPPVAAGQSPGGLGEEGQALPKVPPGTPLPGVSGTEAVLPRAGESTDSRGREVGPNEATAKAPPAKPSVEGAPAASGEEANAAEKKDKPKKEKKSKKDKKRRKPSRPSPAGVRRSREVKAEKSASGSGEPGGSEEQGRSVGSRSRPRASSARARSASKKKEERHRRSDSRHRRKEVTVSREREERRRRTRTPRRSRRREVRDSRSRLRETERQSSHQHRARGSERPAEPVGPPPRPPPGQFLPPYYWSTPARYWGGSKGVKRRERREDIRQFGTDPQRKALRLEREARG